MLKTGIKITGMLLLLVAAYHSNAQYLNRLYDWDTTSDWGWNIFVRPDNSYFISGAGINFVDNRWWDYNMILSTDGSTVLSKKSIKPDSTSVYLGDGGSATSDAGMYILPISVQKRIEDTLRSSAGIMEYNSLGDTVFLRTYSDVSTNFDVMNCVAVMPDGGYLGGGERGKNVPSKCPGLIMKFNNAGDTLWTRTYRKDTSKWVEVHSIVPLGGGRAVLGAQESHWVYAWSTYSHNSPWFIVVDSNGNIIRDTIYGGAYAYGGRLCKDEAGGYWHFGILDTLVTMYPDDLENFPYYLAHLDTNFRMEWITRFPFDSVRGHRYIEKLVSLHDGTVLAIGETWKYSSPNTYGWSAKVGHSGEVLWEHEYTSDPDYDAYLRDAAEKADGSIIMVGATYNDSVPTWHPNRDVWLLGIDANGCETMSCALGVEPPVGSQQPAVSSLQLYPNPTNGAVTVKVFAPGMLKVYSMEGREVSSFAVAKGTNELTLPKEVATGVYMCRFIGESGNSTMMRLVVER